MRSSLDRDKKVTADVKVSLYAMALILCLHKLIHFFYSNTETGEARCLRNEGGFLSKNNKMLTDQDKKSKYYIDILTILNSSEVSKLQNNLAVSVNIYCNLSSNWS